MARSTHLLPSVSSDRYPTALATLAVDGMWVDVPGEPERQQEQLVSWSAVGTVGSAGEYGPNRLLSGSSAADLWDAIAGWLRKRGNLWLVVERAERTLTLLDLWQRLINGEWQVSGSDEHATVSRGSSSLPPVRRDSETANVERRHGAQHGLPVMPHASGRDRGDCAIRRGRVSDARSGRVTISGSTFRVEMRRHGRHGTLTLLGLDNYGLSVPTTTGTAGNRAAWIMEAMRHMCGVLRKHSLGSLQATVASQSMHTYRRAFKTHSILCHDHGPAMALEAGAYYGGRCEAFRLGAIPGRVYHCDVTGAYPAICASHSVPVRLVGYEREPDPNAVGDLLDTYCCFAEVEVACETPDYPYRDDRLGVTVWPTGRFTTVLPHPELVRAMQHGHVRGWKAIAWHEARPALATYAACMLKLRAAGEGGECLAGWLKMMANCLVGKFGQRDRCWRDAPTVQPMGPWSQWWEISRNGEQTRWRTVAGWSQYEHVGGFSNDAVPAIAAYVTSAMRVQLLDMVDAANSRRVWYCDTDSLMVDEVAYERLRTSEWWGPGVPGKLGLKRESDRVKIYGIKSYVEDGRPTQAGISLSDATVDIDAGVVYRVGRAASAARAGHAPIAERVSEPLVLGERYRHGRVTQDGVVHPLRYGD